MANPVDLQAGPVLPERTMTAIVQPAYGTDPEQVLRLGRIARPAISSNEVLVRVGAAGVDRGTWHAMTGEPFLIRLMGFGFARPRNPVPGLDLAGTVTAVGSNVTRFRTGDEVYGFGQGSFAEFAAADQGRLAHKPANLSVAQAAVVPLCGLTALQAIRDAGRVRAGHEVLVLGASGGVGTFAVQLAKASGATVTGVCSTSKMDLVRSLGADTVIDYTTTDFAGIGKRFDVILDIGGSSTLTRLRHALTPRGTVVIIGGERGGQVTNGFGRQLRAAGRSALSRTRFIILVNKKRAADLDSLRTMIEEGSVTPALDRTYPIADAAAAMTRLAAGEVRGKSAVSLHP